MIPMKMAIKKKEVTNSEHYHVMQMEPSAMDMALGEVCMSFMLDRTGKIMHARGGGDGAAFGVDASFMVGKTLGRMIDVFREAEQDGVLDGNDGTVATPKLLIALAMK